MNIGLVHIIYIAERCRAEVTLTAAPICLRWLWGMRQPAMEMTMTLWVLIHAVAGIELNITNYCARTTSGSIDELGFTQGCDSTASYSDSLSHMVADRFLSSLAELSAVSVNAFDAVLM